MKSAKKIVRKSGGGKSIAKAAAPSGAMVRIGKGVPTRNLSAAAIAAAAKFVDMPARAPKRRVSKERSEAIRQAFIRYYGIK